MNEIGEHLGGWRAAPLGAQHANPDRAVKLVLNIDSEGEVIGQVIISVGDALGVRRQDCALAQIGTIAQTINFFLFFASFSETVINMLEGIRTAYRNNSNSFGR